MPFRKTTFYVALVGALTLLGVSGCGTVSYYSQSVIGHSKLMLARQPVAKVMHTAPQELRRSLALSVELKAFAVQQLALPDNRSYTQYVALEREFPVWNVVAAPEFSLQAQHWCYPVIGCAAYRGYFKQSAAEAYAQKMQLKGLETVVGGAAAYSTLGWFSDPILPSMLRYGDVDFAETLFHELAHQRLYVNGDSDFNEAFATVVGEVGAARWLQAARPNELPSYRARLSAVASFNTLIAGSKVRLAKVYQSALSVDEKRHAKAQEFSRLRADYQRLKAQQWQGKGWFDGWFTTPLNNARLAAFSTYYQHVPALSALLEHCDGDFERFFSMFSKPRKADGRVIIPNNCAH